MAPAVYDMLLLQTTTPPPQQCVNDKIHKTHYRMYYLEAAHLVYLVLDGLVNKVWYV